MSSVQFQGLMVIKVGGGRVLTSSGAFCTAPSDTRVESKSTFSVLTNSCTEFINIFQSERIYPKGNTFPWER